MSTYKLQNEHDSNPHREQNRETPRGLLFMIFGVYIPTVFLALCIRGAMLQLETPIISLGIVDSYVRLGMNWLRNILEVL